MKKYEITEEQIKDLAQGKTNKKIKEMFPEVFEEKVELEDNTWYLDASDELFFNRKLDEDKASIGYGWVDGDWFNEGSIRNQYWVENKVNRKATNEEVTEALEKECIKRFGEDWENAKIENCLCQSVPNRGIYSIQIRNNGIWNKNGCIFKDGIWAEPLKEVELTMQQIADKFDVKVENLKIKK